MIWFYWIRVLIEGEIGILKMINRQPIKTVPTPRILTQIWTWMECRFWGSHKILCNYKVQHRKSLCFILNLIVGFISHLLNKILNNLAYKSYWPTAIFIQEMNDSPYTDCISIATLQSPADNCVSIRFWRTIWYHSPFFSVYTPTHWLIYLISFYLLRYWHTHICVQIVILWW